MPSSSQFAWSLVSACTTHSQATSCAALRSPALSASSMAFTSDNPMCLTTWREGVTSSALMPRNSHVVRTTFWRSEEHTSELQSHLNLVCRLLLEKKKN